MGQDRLTLIRLQRALLKGGEQIGIWMRSSFLVLCQLQEQRIGFSFFHCTVPIFL